MDTLGGSAQPAMSGSRPTQPPGALLAIRIDNFDLIERTHGAQLADAVIRQVRGALHAVLGGRDLVAQPYGGSIIAFLPGSGPALARGRAEEVADDLRRTPVPLPGTARAIPVTLSIGIAVAPDHGSTHAALVAAAERALERVSSAGGDAVAVALSPAEEPSSPPLALHGFVGRGDQVRSLVRLLDESIARRPSLAIVHGESGVGVSTVLRQLTLETGIRGGVTVVARATQADVRAPYDVWRQAIDSLLREVRIPRGDWHELANLVAAAAPPGAPAAPGGPGSGSQYRLLEELTECIAAGADQRPLVIVLEEMQWADSASWDALEHVLAQLRDKPVLLVVTVADDRLGADARERRARLAEHAKASEIAVPRLTRDEVKRWLEHAFHGQDVGRGFLSFVYGHTRGNALFIAQLLRALAEEGAVWHTGEKWEWRPASELRFPAGLEALLVRRLERLAGRSQLALATAAVIGRPFDASLLAAVLGGGEVSARQVIAESLAAGLLEPMGPGHSHVRFVHEMVSDVLRTHLPPRRHQRIHRNIADVLAAFSVGDDGEVAAHFDRAGVQREAYLRAMSAAGHAERLFAYQSANECLQLAARNAATPSELAETRTRLAVLADRMGRFDEAEELCDLAIEWYQGQEDHGRTIQLRLLRERCRDQLGQPARRTLEALAQLDREAEARALASERVAILTTLSQAYGRLGDPASAERIAAQCVRMAEELGDPKLLGESLNRFAGTLEHGRWTEQKAIQRRAIRLFQQAGDSRGQARGYNNLGIVAQLEGALDEAGEALAMAIAVARTAKMPDLWGTAACNLGVMRLKEGRYAEARTLFEQGLSLFTAVKTAELQLYALYNLAHVARAEGQHHQAAETYEMAASLAQRIGTADVELGASGGAGLSLLELGRVEQATESFNRVASRLLTRGDWFQGRELPEALGIRLAVAKHKGAQAVAQFTAALRLAEGADAYGGAWLTAACASYLGEHAPEVVREAVARYVPRVASMGYAELTARFQELSPATA